LNERILREQMKEEFTSAVATLKKKPNEDEPSLFDQWKKDFTELGAEKCAQFIVYSNTSELRTEAIRQMGRDPLLPDAPEEEVEAYKKEFVPLMEGLLKTSVDEMKTQDVDELANQAVDIQVDLQANKSANDLYRLRLIRESIFEKETDTSGAPLTDKYKLVFDNTSEIEELLAPTTIDDLASMIAEEVRIARSVPLNLVSTS
jgi:hypothetical protein